MKRIVLFGSTGRLGRAMLPCFGQRCRITAPREEELDLTDAAAVRSLLVEQKPEIIINAAAYTDVDGAEEHRDTAFRINADVVGDLARMTKETQAVLVHFSTDFVFDGTKGAPYTEEDTPAPLSVYGHSKLAGEEAVTSELSQDRYLLIRTSWLFAPWGPSYPAGVLKWAKKGAVKAPTDVVGSPTYVLDLVEGLRMLLDRGARGVLHVANAGAASRFDQASQVVETAGLAVTVERATASDFPAPAPRPSNSALDCTRYAAHVGSATPGWEEAIARWYRAYVPSD